MTTMHIRFAAFLALTPFALAGCDQRDAAGSAPAQTAASTAETAGTALPVALPQGFSLGFPYRYTGQEIARTGKAQRQRITVEFLAGDVNSTVGSLAQSALAAGFAKGLWGIQKDGSIHLVADKAGYGQLRMQIKPIAAGETPQNAAARGTVTIGWPARAPALQQSAGSK